MKKHRVLSTFCAVAAALATAAMGVQSANAAPLHIPVPAASASAPDVMQVNHRGFYHRGGHVYYHGHRGHRHHRHGYRYHQGYWFPPAAFALGAIIGGAIAAAPAPRYYERRVYPAPVHRYSVGSAHERWCYDRYRSYRAWDNTFQPYHGPRRQCWSPYN